MSPNDTARAISSAARAKGAKLCTIPLTSWGVLESENPGVVPNWYKELLSKFSLAGDRLSFPNLEGEDYPFEFWVRLPGAAVADCGIDYGFPLFEDEDDDREALQAGWFPFAEESDGSYWAIPSGGGQDSRVVWISHSGGGVGAPNGVQEAAHTFSDFLSKLWYDDN